MLVKFVNSITAKEYEINVVMSAPYPALTVAIENIVDGFPAEVQAEHGRVLISAINSAMKNNAVRDVVNSADIFVAMAERVTFGKYTIKPGENGTGYALGSSTTADKEVKVYNTTAKKSEKVRRPAFVTYDDCTRYAKALNRERKKANADLFILPGDFSASEMRKLRYFIRSAENRLSEKDVENLSARGAEYAPFSAGMSNEAKKSRVSVFYDIFNARTGKAVKPVHHVENNVVKECTSYNSMYKLDASANESKYISALFNEWLNSELVTATAYRAKAPETVGKKKPAEKVENPEVKPEESKPINPKIEEGSIADLWIIEKMAENDWSREQAEKAWLELEKAMS
jgi:hypothetical protein